MFPGMEVDDYKACANPTCRKPTLVTIIHQCGGFCFDCWLQRPAVTRFHALEVATRGGKITTDMRKKRSAAAQAGRARERDRQRTLDANSAQLRAARRMKHLFPEVFAVLLAEERHARGLPVGPAVEPDALTKAVATYNRFRTYDAESREEPEDGAASTQP